MNVDSHFPLQLLIVVPILGWKDYYTTNDYFWMIKLAKNSGNKLTKDSAANAFEVKSVSAKRFRSKMGVVTNDQLDFIAQTIAYCIGFAP